MDYEEFLAGISSFRSSGEKALRCEMLILLAEVDLNVPGAVRIISTPFGLRGCFQLRHAEEVVNVVTHAEQLVKMIP